MNDSSKNSRKKRVDFRKNRGRRERDGNLSHRPIEELEDLAGDERLSGKGALTRRRTIITDSDETGGVLRDVSAPQTLVGRVLTAVGSNHCAVQTSAGVEYRCTTRRVVRTMSRDARNAVVAGDIVLVTPDSPATAVIERVQPRRGTLSRVSRGSEHIIVANVDQAVIVASAAQPDLKPGLIDRFLCSALKGNVSPLICINKVDLVPRASLQPVAGRYAKLGCPVVLTDTLTGQGVEELRQLLQGRESVFTGQSGVGKSSLLNAVQPGLGRLVGRTSEDSGKGRHTTRVTELIPLSQGGWVVDTPGIRQLDLWDVAPGEVEGCFIEFRPIVSRCRFPDCTHTHEAGCGVHWGVERGLISRERFASYQRIHAGDAE